MHNSPAPTRRNRDVQRRRRRLRRQARAKATSWRYGAPSKYRGAQGLDPEFIKSLEKQFGFDKPAYERFFLMIKNYLRFDFGESYFRDTSVLGLILEKMPVSISLGLVDDASDLSHLDPARHPQGGERRLALRRLDEHGHRHRLRRARLSRCRVSDRAVRRRLVPADSSRCAGSCPRIGGSCPGT